MDFFLNDLGQYFSVHSQDTIQDVSKYYKTEYYA